MSSDGARLATADLGFAYAGREVLDGVSLAVEAGEVVGLLGPNGAGKSTLVRVLSGVLRPYRGSVSVGGDEVRDLARRELARRLAVVPQEPVFGFPYSVLEVVLMGRHPHRRGLALESAADLAAARAALERCGAAELAARPIHELSSGERQRVVFARALAQEPRALVLDEPASFLDVRHQVELYDRLRELVAERSVAVLVVLHDLNLAAEYCNRVVLLAGGRVAAAGETAAVFDAATLQRVFGTEIHVTTNAVTGRPLLAPLPGRLRSDRPPAQSVARTPAKSEKPGVVKPASSS